jgi:hypothetical protein
MCLAASIADHGRLLLNDDRLGRPGADIGSERLSCGHASSGSEMDARAEGKYLIGPGRDTGPYMQAIGIEINRRTL